MDIAARYPEISLKIFLGFVVAVPVLVALVFIGRRAPRTKAPSALLFGLALGASFDHLEGEIRQRRLDDRVLAAASHGNATALRSALDDGGSANVDDPTSGGWPALGNAIDSGDPQTVKLLLQRGADPRYGNWDQTSVEMGNKAKRPDLVRLLRRYGAR